jgi:DNA repair protein RadA/Sms
MCTGSAEFDRVLGGGTQGGMVAGAAMLVGGEPGIGKSTILTQLAVHLVAAHQATVAYVCGEESPTQIALRLRRLELPKQFSQEKLVFLTTTDADEIVSHMVKLKPGLVIIDSLQTLTTQDLTGAAGSFGQMRTSVERITQCAKRLHTPVFFVGHVTKEGELAGPKVVEHLVDAVLELTGERTGELRLLRTLKNRFGPTDEVGIFQMTETGMSDVSNPNQLFVEHTAPTPGSAVACVLEGTRPLVVEVQALAVKSQLAMPRRVGRGIQLSRIQVLSAVLEKFCGLPLSQYDIFVNVAGGFVINEPSVDLALATAIASSLKSRPLSHKVVCFGEVGLLGEVRPVSYAARREKEAKRLGFDQVASRATERTLAGFLKSVGLS